MSKPKREWIVTPHQPIQKLEDNLWVVEGDVPGFPGGIQRRMAIIKRTDGTLVFFHALPLEDAILDEIRAWGEPKYLVVGHDQHCIDAHAFQQKLKLQAYSPRACQEKVRARVDLAGSLEEMPPDASLSFESVPGTKHGELMALIKSGTHTTLIFSDVIQNNPKEGMPFMFRMMGFAGGPKVVPAFRMLFTKDKAQVRQALNQWADLPGLHRVIPFHGTIVEKDPAGALRAAAATL
jgi:hypothetical protein